MKFSSLAVSYFLFVGADAKVSPDGREPDGPNRALRKTDNAQKVRKLNNGVTFHTSSESFNDAGGSSLTNFVCEDFEDHPLPDNDIQCCDSVISSSNPTCWNSIVPGFSVRISPDRGACGTFLSTNGYAGQSTAKLELVTGIIEFTAPTSGVSFDTTLLFEATGDINIEAFDADGISLGSETITVTGTVTGPDTYVGILAGLVPIKTITFRSPRSGFDVLDNLCFAVPTEEADMDPHFKTFAGKWYDYMGECDLHLLQAPFFDGHTALAIDIRTRIRYDYSYIETAAVKIGEDILEVGSWGEYFINGVEGAELPATLSGFPIKYNSEDKKVHFEIQIARGETIVISTFKDMVRIKLINAQTNRFHGSTGMMGDYDTGATLARNGTVVIEDPNALALDWQVRHDEPMLFQATRAPQHPQACVLPSKGQMESRRLGGTSLSYEAAKEACATWGDRQEQCIHDVLATGDLELAEAGAF